MNESSTSGASGTLPLPLVTREPPARAPTQAQALAQAGAEPPRGPAQATFQGPVALARAHETEDAVRAVLEGRSPGRVVVSDAFELLRSLPDESIDLVVTDPPYTSLELHRSRGTTTRLTTNWFATVPDEKLPELLSSVQRVLRRDRHFYLFCDEVTADIIKQQQGVGAARKPNGARLCASGLVYWKEIVWAKTTLDGSRIRGGTGYHYRAACERILFFEKGKRALADLAIPDVLLAPRPGIPGPAVKPIAIARTLIAQSSTEGDLVLDPFAGSGVVGTAARELSRRFLLGDLDLAYLDPRLADAAPLGAARLLQHELDEPLEPPPLEAIAKSGEAQLLSDAAEMRDAAEAAGWLAEGAITSALEELLAIRPVEREAAVRRALRNLSARPEEPRLLRAWRAWALSGRRR
jgi:site-specific DNA-methyltransferase (adenine-specific)